jgi:[ribosomal protein S18]-alanine N-acetyltransferase
MPVIVRSATLDDLPAIVDLERQAASAAHWSPEQYKPRIVDGRVFVAGNAGQLRGFLCARTVAGEWEIENVVVAEGSRRCGIGGELVRALVAAAVGANGSAVRLEVRESNHAARRLYEKHGFREEGRRRAYYRDPLEDALVYGLACACPGAK